MPSEQNNINDLTRRDFLKTSAVTTLGVSAGLLASGNFAYAAGSDTLRVGLVGCGGRGTGAARDAVVSADGVETWPTMAKHEVAARLIERIAEALRDRDGSS